MSTTITSHLNAIKILALTTPSITAPVETLIKTVQTQADDLAQDLGRARRWADEAQTKADAASTAKCVALSERDQARREMSEAKAQIAKAATVDLLRELAGSPAKLLLVLREAGLAVSVCDLAGTPTLAEDEIAILSDPAQHGPSVIAVLVKV